MFATCPGFLNKGPAYEVVLPERDVQPVEISTKQIQDSIFTGPARDALSTSTDACFELWRLVEAVH